jgi:hypothetical protein
MPNPQVGGPPLVGCPQLLIQYICSYPPYLEGVSSIRNLRTCHAVVMGDPPNMAINSWAQVHSDSVLYLGSLKLGHFAHTYFLKR